MPPPPADVDRNEGTPLRREHLATGNAFEQGTLMTRERL